MGVLNVCNHANILGFVGSFQSESRCRTSSVHQKVLSQKNKLNLNNLQLTKSPTDFNYYLLPPHLGGVDLRTGKENQTFVDDAQAMRLMYVLDSSEDLKASADIWEDGALQACSSKVLLKCIYYYY